MALSFNPLLLIFLSTWSCDQVRGHGGSLYFEDTVVTSWDTPNKAPQEEYEGGRSFLNCVSEKLTGETCDGNAKNDRGECRMVSLSVSGVLVEAGGGRVKSVCCMSSTIIHTLRLK